MPKNEEQPESVPAEMDETVDTGTWRWKKRQADFALNHFEYCVTLDARLALGHGIDRETVAAILHSLAEAIRTQDCAENMDAVDDGSTLEQLIQ
jgi:hypothetical protein